MTLVPFAFATGVGTLVLPFALPVTTLHAFVVVGAATAAWWRIAIVLGSARRYGAPLAFLAGYAYAAAANLVVLDARMPACSDAVVRGFELRITTPPEALPAAAGQVPAARFVAEVEAIDPATDCPGLDRHRLRLTWYDPPPLEPGQRWRAQGRLRPVWGYLNPGGFDYERWLLGQRLDGTGYVSRGERIASASRSLPGDRSLRSRLTAAVGSGAYAERGLMLALLLGDDTRIERTQWSWLRDSGLIHLVVVSGLHVAIVTLTALRLGMGLARMFPCLLERFGARRVAAPAAIAAGAAYVLITGVGVPALRAWMMSAIAIACVVSGRRISALDAFGWVVAAVLAGDPLAVHQQGFWLSFAAVAALLVTFLPRRGPAAAWRKLLLAQGALFVGLTPLIAALQHAVPLAGPFVNLLAVPLVSVLVLPLLLASGVAFAASPDLAALGFEVADALLAGVSWLARLCDALPPLAAAPGGGWRLVVPAIAGVLILCGAARRWQVMLVAAWMGSLATPVARPVDGQFRLTALDVGQGSALLIETRHRQLLFDAGPAFPGGFDLGEAVVLPSLARLGIRALDGLVLSHDDLDHSGGAPAIAARVPIARLWTSYAPPESLRIGGRVVRCIAGQRWDWDSVAFEFLSPEPGTRTNDNDGSCVMLVSGRSGRALLTGDISKRIERRLLARGAPPVDVLTAPHHGSNGSSSAAWVHALRPRLVLVSAPRRSRYGHPHPDVVARYRAIGARVLTTGESGAVVWRSAASDATQLRGTRRAYWRGAPAGEADSSP